MKHTVKHTIKPTALYRSVTSINVEQLYEQGIETLLIDIDNTLVPRDTKVIPAEVRIWINAVKRAGLKTCLLSNNWHRLVFDYSKELDVPLVYRAMKPAPFAFIRALHKVGGERSSACMIGDQLFTDALGAGIVGMRSLIVQPQSQVDLWYTQLFRKLEAHFTSDLEVIE